MNLRKLLIIHALITFAAGIVLIFSPQLIPGTVGIQIYPKANLLCYLLGTSEVSKGGNSLSAMFQLLSFLNPI